jgi:anti-sigma factor RsiW
MTQQNPLNEQERADLVAYLDGELGGEAARAVEARLQLDPAVRAEAESLRRTWDLLDYLPKPAAPPDFTHRTLEKLAPVRAQPKAAATTPAAPRRGRRWLLGVAWAASVLLAAAAGYAGVGLFAPRDRGDADVVRDLRVLDNKRYYDHCDDLDFLRDLDQPDLFGDDTPGS